MTRMGRRPDVRLVLQNEDIFSRGEEGGGANSLSEYP